MISNRAYWIGEAHCALPDTEYLRKVNAWDSDVVKFREEAVDVCAECPVRRMCYDDAVEDRLSDGIRAGVLFKIRTERDAASKKPGTIPEYIEMQEL